MNSFEKYLQENKEKLDLEPVNPDGWLALENKILKAKNKRSVKLIRWVSSAAAAALVLIMAISYWQYTTHSSIEILAQNGLNSEQYVQEVNYKTKALSSAEVPVDRKEDFDLLLVQLKFLDDQYNDYLQYVELNGYQEFIGEQILNYYKTKIELLDKIQQEINKIEYYEKKYDKEVPKVGLSL